MVAGRWTRVRVLACGVGFAALFAAVLSRAYELQVKDGERLRVLAEEQYLRELELPPRRGRILDRNGAELASTADVDSISCNPRQLPDAAEAASQLAAVLGLDQEELERRLTQRKRYFAWIKRHVTPDEVAEVRRLAIPGVGFTREPRRFYPNRTIGATVLGHSGADGRGLDGIELAFDQALRGTPSTVQGIRDALGRELLVEGMADSASAVAGHDLVLTLDKYVSYVAERALADAVVRHRAKGAVAVVMDPRSGDVLAMASAPTYDPNDPSEAAVSGARNRAITDTYEPGSTMKTFTIAGALDAQVVRSDDRFDCMMGRMKVGRYQIHDTHPHGALTVADIFKKSSNIGATKIARRLGAERLSLTLERLGFGRPTAIGLPGERSGILRPVQRWGDIGLSNVSFGQGLTVTPLQMAAAVAAVAAGGVYQAPRVVSQQVAPDGRVLPAAVRPPVRVISARAARELIQIMRTVTEPGGTAKRAAIPGYQVAGKTGTAQKVVNGRYDPSKYIPSFVGFAPAGDPRVVAIVVIDEPQGAHLGGEVAAPVFREIVEQVLRYLHVPPTENLSPPEKAQPGVAVKPAEPPPDERPGTDLAFDPDEPTQAALDDGHGDTGEPRRPSDADGDSAEVAVVPNFSGMSLGQVIRTARRAGIEVLLEGSGVARTQKPDPGPAPRGAVCRVSFTREE